MHVQNFWDAETTKCFEREGDLRVAGQGWEATRENHPKLIIRNFSLCKQVIEHLFMLLLTIKHGRDLIFISLTVFFPIEDVESLVFGHLIDPTNGIVGHPFIRPLVHGFEQGILYYILGKLDVASTKRLGKQ